MNKAQLIQLRPHMELYFSLLDEIEQKEQLVSSVRHIATTVQKQNAEMNEELQKVKRENHAMQLFIEEHVDEDKKKLIFGQSETVH
jgi:hypothetical protein